jgi:hypothetical protein
MAGGDVTSRAVTVRARAFPTVSATVGSVVKRSTSPARVTDQTYRPPTRHNNGALGGVSLQK